MKMTIPPGLDQGRPLLGDRVRRRAPPPCRQNSEQPSVFSFSLFSSLLLGLVEKIQMNSGLDSLVSWWPGFGQTPRLRGPQRTWSETRTGHATLTEKFTSFCDLTSDMTPLTLALDDILFLTESNINDSKINL
jgi:hypothetical protein